MSLSTESVVDVHFYYVAVFTDVIDAIAGSLANDNKVAAFSRFIIQIPSLSV